MGRSARIPPASPFPTVLRTCMCAAVVMLAAGCMRPLALQQEYFRPGSGVAHLAAVQARHVVGHHRALQAAQRVCPPPEAAATTGAPDLSDAGPDFALVAAREALVEVCTGTVAETRPVSAHGAAGDAFRRWTEGEARELPAAGEIAASAAGG
ncbi:MAG: hypothetical protein OXC01_17830 [Immundisolibacterales bacterium]|nr:hypothetical protein [Immundisolibacterales bacterium]